MIGLVGGFLCGFATFGLFIYRRNVTQIKITPTAHAALNIHLREAKLSLGASDTKLKFEPPYQLQVELGESAEFTIEKPGLLGGWLGQERNITADVPTDLSSGSLVITTY